MAAGLLVHIGKKEQSETFAGEKLSSLSLGALPPSAAELSDWAKGKIEQIDCIWFQTDGTPCFAFEVEASTPITTGIDRFLELLNVNPALAGRLVIVAPPGRERLLNRILRGSHYVGHPLYMENKLAYMFYGEFYKLYGASVGLNLDSAALVQKFEKALSRPKINL